MALGLEVRSGPTLPLLSALQEVEVQIPTGGALLRQGDPYVGGQPACSAHGGGGGDARDQGQSQPGPA